MYVSPRRIEFARETLPAAPRPWTRFRPVLAYIVLALLAAGGAATLGQSGVAAPAACGEDPAAVCGSP